MTLSEYFDNTAGLGVLATSDKLGNINLALYTTPRVVGVAVIAFVMRPRLSLRNLRSNSRAAYIYLEHGGSVGRRLQLTMFREELRRRPGVPIDGQEKYVVYFHVDRIGPLTREHEHVHADDAPITV